MRNTFGNLFTLTTFGESHGIAVGGVIDGFPADIEIDMDFIQSELNRRRPGQSHITTSRNEADKVEFLSGVFEGKSTGTPIGFEVRNTNQHSHRGHASSLPLRLRQQRAGGHRAACPRDAHPLRGPFCVSHRGEHGSGPAEGFQRQSERGAGAWRGRTGKGAAGKPGD